MHNGRLWIDTRHWQVERQETEDSIGDRDRDMKMLRAKKKRGGMQQKLPETIFVYLRKDKD